MHQLTATSDRRVLVIQAIVDFGWFQVACYLFPIVDFKPYILFFFYAVPLTSVTEVFGQIFVGIGHVE
jgi:hypothetical protein